MIRINENFLRLPGSYLFQEVAHRVAAEKAARPDGQRIISLGIGDVTRPIPHASIKAMQKAAAEMGNAETFRGYGPEQGYDFLRQAISQHDYKANGISIGEDEIFVSDGAKSDTAGILDILSASAKLRVALCDPVYPVYVDSNVMAGRGGKLLDDGHWSDFVYLPCTAENGFSPSLPHEGEVDLIYLCLPCNPTGATLTRSQLKPWVDYCLRNRALLLFDAAYEAFIQTPDVPHSIYEIEGAKKCAIEFRSFSKTAGFTGMRCAYLVIPNDLVVTASDGSDVEVKHFWSRRQATKMNGVSYPVQRAAEAVFSPDGQKEVRENIDYYHENAKIMLNGFAHIGLTAYGGVDSPYIWLKTPNGVRSWDFFDKLLQQLHVVTTPGVGFGPAGEGYIRLTAFGSRNDCIEAVERIKSQL